MTRSVDEQVCCIYRLKPGMGPEYDRRHSFVWPEVLTLIRASGIHDYSIFRRGELVISVYRVPEGAPDVSERGGEIQARWTQSMAHIFEEIVDADGESLWARRIFRLDR